MRSTVTARPAAFILATTWRRPSPSAAVSARRVTPRSLLCWSLEAPRPPHSWSQRYQRSTAGAARLERRCAGPIAVLRRLLGERALLVVHRGGEAVGAQRDAAAG